MYLHSVPVEVGPWYRVDSASGSNTPVTVQQLDGVTTVPNHFGGTGSTVGATSARGNAEFTSATATLYLKRLTYQGAVAGDTPLTSTGADRTQPTPGPVTPTDIEVDLDVRAFGVVGNGVADDTAALQRALNASTLAAPRRILLPPGTFKITSALTFPFAPGTEICGSGRLASVIMQATNGAKILKFGSDNTHSVVLQDLSLSYTNQQTTSGGVAVYYDVAGGTSFGFYHHTYRQLTIDKSYRAFSVEGADGQQTVWDSTWEDIVVTNAKNAAVNLKPQSPIGQPNNVFRRFGVYNSGGLQSTGACIVLTAGEAIFQGLDVEGWYDLILDSQAGAVVAIQGLHVENHVFDTASSTLLLNPTGSLSVDGFSIKALCTSNNATRLRIVDATSSGTASFSRGTVNITSSIPAATSEFAYAPSGRSVLMQDVRNTGTAFTSWPTSDVATRTKLVELGLLSGGTSVGVQLGGDTPIVRSGAGAVTVAGATFAQAKLLSSFASPYTICHNGTNNVIPTHTIAGYDYAMSVGLPVMDIDVQLLADGQLANMHNSAVDSDTTATGNVNTFTAFDFKKLTTDASSWLAPGYADTNPTLVADILGRYGTRAVYVLEAKDGSTGTVQKIVNLVTALGVKGQTVVQSTVLASLAPAVTAGIMANHITNSPDATALAAAGVSMVTMLYNTGNVAAISAAVAAGLTVWVYGIQRRYEYAAATALGVVGVMSDDPAYSTSSTAFMTKDTFARQTWAPGHILAANSRGSLISGGKLQYSAGQNASTLLGFLCPVANAASSYQIDWTWTYDAAGASASAYAFMHIGAPDDRAFPNNISSGGYADGWRFYLAQNGTLAIYKTDRAAGTATNPVANVAATAPVDGVSVAMRANVTPTQVILSIPAQSKTVTVTDSTFRGGYIHCGQQGNGGAMQTSISGITVT
jgi:glycerophosphoryl diester phosphodiesterase